MLVANASIPLKLIHEFVSFPSIDTLTFNIISITKAQEDKKMKIFFFAFFIYDTSLRLITVSIQQPPEYQLYDR
jgi:hypothetical protein